MSISRGNHSFKFGGEVTYEKIVHDTLLDNYGVLLFQRHQDRECLRRLPPRSAGNDDARTRRCGRPTTGRTSACSPRTTSAIHPRVTLNLGVRYDLQFPFTRSPGPQAGLSSPVQKSQVSPTAPEGLLFPGDQGIGRGIVKTDKNNIAPRLGIAWDPKGDGRMAVRAGFGIFYGSITGNEWNTTADNQPFTVRQSFPDGLHACPIRTGTCPAASARSRSTTTRPAPGSRCRPRSSDRRSTSSGPTPTR